jgi:hypothetical protein
MTTHIGLAALATGEAELSDQTLPDGLTVAQLGKVHVDLVSALDVAREALNHAMRAERDAGATYAQLMKESGYRSIEQVRQIVKPGAREAVRAREAQRRRPKAD